MDQKYPERFLNVVLEKDGDQMDSVWQIKKYYKESKKEELFCHILLRNYVLKHFTEGKIDQMGIWRRRRRQLLED